MEGFGLGEPYNYVNNIKNPDELGISSSGDKIAENIANLFHYVQLLSSGGQAATKDPGTYMGNKQFLPTLSKCIPLDDDVNEKGKSEKIEKCGETTVDMSLYVNDIPSGKFTPSMQGLVPGIIEDSVGIIPNFDVDSLQGKMPQCACVNLPIKINDGVGNPTTNRTEYSDEFKRYKAKYKKGENDCWFISKSHYDRLVWSKKIDKNHENKYKTIFDPKSKCSSIKASSTSVIKQPFTNMSSSEKTLVNTTNSYVFACLVLFMYIAFKAIHR